MIHWRRSDGTAGGVSHEHLLPDDVEVITPEEFEAALQADVAAFAAQDEAAGRAADEHAAQAAALRQAAVDKLLALGLSEDEARAVVGV